MKRAEMIRLQAQNLIIQAPGVNDVSRAMKMQGLLESALNGLCEFPTFPRPTKSILSAHRPLLRPCRFKAIIEQEWTPSSANSDVMGYRQRLIIRAHPNLRTQSHA
jgi:hypothetical protein